MVFYYIFVVFYDILTWLFECGKFGVGEVVSGVDGLYVGFPDRIFHFVHDEVLIENGIA